MGTPAARIVKIDALRAFMERLLVAAGCDAEGAAAIAETFLQADLMGTSTQGLHHLTHLMVPTLRSGKIKPAVRPRIARSGAAYALIDGGRGPGPLAGIFAADLAAAGAKTAGAYAVGIVNSNDIYFVGYYGERIARAGCIGFVVTDAAPRVHPSGGTGRVLGTNPLAIAVPTAGEHPWVLDLATSAWSGGLVQQAMEHGEPLPAGIAVDPEGRPTTDASAAWMGALAPFGGHKGFGLSLSVALLSGPLLGAETGQALAGWRGTSRGQVGNKGHLFLAIDPGAFGSPARFRNEVSTYISNITASRKASGEGIRGAGDRSFAERTKNLRAGTVPVYESTLAQATTLASALGLPPLD